MANTVKAKLAYQNTEVTRTYILDEVSDDAIDPVNIQTAVSKFNSVIANPTQDPEGTTVDVANFFINANGDKARKIVEVITESVEETPII